jgi:ketosteroid isomerase-like protein
MRYFLIVFIYSTAALSLFSHELKQQAKGPESDKTQTEQAIRALERQLSEAVVRGDRAIFDRLFADDFTHTSHTGAFKTKAEWMAEGKSADRQPGKTTYDAYQADDLAVRIYGETAVVTGRLSPKGTNAQGKPMSGQYRFLRVWVKRGGDWRVVAFQGTRIAAS